MCIPGGSSYAVEIPRAIKDCKVFVVVLSERTQTSKWVPRELDQAINENKIIMPFMVENCRLKDDFNFYLTNVQRYNAYESKAETIRKMINEIKAILDCAEVEKRKNEAPPKASVAAEKAPEVLAVKNEKPKEAEKPRSVRAQPAQRQPAKKAKQKKTADAKTRKKAAIIGGAVGAAAVVLISVILVVSVFSKVTVAGEKFKKSDASVALSDVTLMADDMAELAKLENLTALKLTNCKIEATHWDEALLSRLITLDLSNCDLSETNDQRIDFSKMPKLRILNLSGNKNFSDLTVLQPLAEKLDTLDISNTAVTDLKPLSGFSALTSLSVNGNGLTSLEGIEGCLYLEKLLAADNKLTSLESLKNTTLLTTVDLNGNSISKLSVLQNSAKTLNKLYVSGNTVSDLSPLTDCTALQTVNLDGNPIASLEALAELTSMQAFSAVGTHISGEVNLAQWSKLTYLNLADNQITALHLNAFEGGAVRTLNLANNRITEVNLPTGCHYRYLFLQGNPLASLGSLSASKGGTLCMEYIDTADYAAFSSTTGFREYVILHCPDNRKAAVKEAMKKFIPELVENVSAEFTAGSVPEEIKTAGVSFG